LIACKLLVSGFETMGLNSWMGDLAYSFSTSRFFWAAN
jgi:hypothetical protein